MKFQSELKSIDKNGQIFQYDDQGIWKKYFEKFNFSCRVIEDIYAEVFVLPSEDGCLFKGKVQGKIALPCDRCAEEIIVPILSEFAEFEDYPSENLDNFNYARNAENSIGQLDEIIEENKILFLDHGAIYIDFEALLWEEFVLALPSKPLCDVSCKGICSNCGKNLNLETCDCEDEGADPRFAALRKLKIQ